MDELQKKPSQRYEARSRKVRFKVSSAYSGRVLKQVYEDGQELEIPPEEYPHSFRHWNFEPRDTFWGISENPGSRFCPPSKLNTQRISVFREGNKYTLTSNSSLLSDHQTEDNHMHPPILDFGKIIIYTSNLKIIRTPMTKKEMVRKIMENEGMEDCSFLHNEGRRNNTSNPNGKDGKEADMELAHSQCMQDGDHDISCSQCKGSGSAPCSLCHGSKFSMLANRFKESYRALRCPACNENGQQPCQTCAQ
uniref:Glutaredoxin and cysteine rich domain containing 2 n=1 Tax=Salvator merianae TaxID=96440 RepID=A0A8D0DXB7_SALMN